MSTAQPLFTIATITYNSSKWVRQTIESILASPYTDLEFIISDDCSKDETWNIIDEYNDPRLIKWRNEKNIGEYPNRNKVLNQAKGQYILYVDGDDILYGEALERLAKHIQFFPNAGSFWGVGNIDIIVYPYQLSPLEAARLLFLSPYFNIATIGLTETLFKVSALKEIGGFHNNFAIGDTYIKKKIACFHPVVLTSPGFGFWRLTPNQASSIVAKNNRNTIENFQINLLILQDPNFPLSGIEKDIATMNAKISVVKLIFKNSIIKGRFMRFFQLMKRANLSILESKRLFQKIDLQNKTAGSSAAPLINSYHFNSLR